jgi:hypothetical protein
MARTKFIATKSAASNCVAIRTDREPFHLHAPRGRDRRSCHTHSASVNGLAQTVRGGLLAKLEKVAADQSIRAVVLTGNQRFFCAGADIRRIRHRPLGSRTVLAKPESYRAGLIQLRKATRFPLRAEKFVCRVPVRGRVGE